MRYLVGCLALPVVLIVMGIIWTVLGPIDDASLGCKVLQRYKVEAVIEADGQRFNGEATVVVRGERFKYGRLLSWNGCHRVYGQAMAFRLPRDRLLLMRAPVCLEASDALDSNKSVDARAVCYRVDRRELRQAYPNLPSDAFIIDGINAPREWHHVMFGDGEANLVRLRATRVFWGGNHDSLEEVAPALLATRFEYVHWENSPATLIPDARREDRPLRYVAAMAITERPSLPSQ